MSHSRSQIPSNALALVFAFVGLCVEQPARAATITFDGGVGGNGTTLDAAANWAGDAIPTTTSEVLFNNSAITLPAALTTASAATFGDLIINSTTLTSLSLTGATSSVITLSGGGGSVAAIAAGGATGDLLLLGSAVTGSVTLGGGSGAGKLGFDLGSNGNFNVVNAGASADVTGIVSGSFTLTKTGAGTLTLSGINTHTGGTTIKAGTLAAGNKDALGTGTLQLSGGTLQATSALTGATALANVVTLTAGSTIGGATDIELSGEFTNSAASNTLTVNNTGLTIISGPVWISESSSNRSLTFNGTGNILISGAIGKSADGLSASATGNLNYRGSGTLTLTGLNSFGGVLSVSGGGTLSEASLSTAHAGIASNTNGLRLGDSTGTGRLLYTGSGEIYNKPICAGTAAGDSTGIIDQSGASGLLKLGGSITSVFSGNKTMILQGSTAGTGEVSGVVSNGTATSLSLTKQGTGTWTLSAANTYTGGTNLAAGALNFTTGGLGTTGAVTFTGNSTLQYGASTTTDLSSRLVISNGVTATVDTNGNNVTFGTGFGASGTGALIKVGAGTLSLNAANTYTGLTTVNAGTLAVGSGGSLASGNALTLGASGLATFANVGQTLGAVSNANTASNALNFSASTGTVTLASLSGAGNTRFGSDSIVTGDISAGTVTSVGNLTANISGGTTTVGGVATIGTLSGGTANLNGATSAVTTLNGGTVNLGSGTTLTVSGGTTAGVIAGTAGSLTKIGPGTLTFTGINTYTGATTVSAGTLALNTSGTAALANTSAVVVATGASVSLGAANQINAAASLTLNGGTMVLGGFSQTLGTLDLNASSALSLGGSAALVFANSSALDWNSATFSVSNFEVGTNSLRFGTTSSGLTATQLGLFRFVEFGNSAARIDADGFIVPLSTNYLNSGSIDLVISTDITGTTTVDQTGTGSTTLTAPASTPNTSSGLASVTQGTLVIGTVAGGNWAGNVTVSGTGTLKGRGDIGGAVIVNSGGTYSPGNSPAIQHVGSLTVNTGGFVTIELDGTIAGNGVGFHDRVISAGAVTLSGGTLNGQTIFTGSSVPAYLPTLGAVHAVITGSTVTGTFSAYDFSANPAGLSFLPEYTATAVNLYAVPANYATDVVGLNANQTQVGAALQSLRLSRPLFELDQRTTLDDRATLFNGLKTQDAAGLRTAYDQLTPEKLTALAANTFQSASILNYSLQQRSAELRRFGAASVSLNGVATPAVAEDYSVQTVIEDGVHYQIAKAKPQKRYGYFASATGAFAAVDGASERLGSFSQTGAATAGIDYALNPNQSVGLVVSQALADTDFSSNSGRSRTTTSRVGVFHDYHNEGFFVNTSVSAGFSAYDSKRKITFLNQTASGETQGFSYGGQLATGYDFKVGGFIVGPTASVVYDHAHINGFEETGSAADLRVGRQNADSLITKLGVHVSRPFVANKIGWIPDLSLSASRQSFNPNRITARLAAGGDAFRVSPQAGGSEYINPGASLSALLPNGWTMRLSYDAILNPQFAEHRVNLSVGAGF